ncbi:hypothetical protein L6278_02225, partial [Candidatus Parcubacteria bacterium]|nr:hypothetical protein [Candidatus Parcubacteria bacterium]
KNFSNKNFLNIYLSGQYFQDKINSEDIIFPLILNNLNLDFNEPAFLNLKARENKIVYNFNALAQNKASFEKFNTVENLDNLVNLNDDEIFASFFISNLKDIFEFLFSEHLTLEQKEIWQKKYDLDDKKIKEIVNYSGIFLTQAKNNKLDNKDVLNLEKYNYALILKTDKDDIEKIDERKENIKQIIKNIAAFKNPVEKIKKLADSSSSIELIADPASIDFISENNLEILNVQNFNFVITTHNSNLILGNSKELITEILQDGSKQSDGANTDCDFLTGSEALIMNTNKLTNGVLSFVDKLILNFEQNGKNINLNGCFLW